jgi:hypothetical protein
MPEKTITRGEDVIIANLMTQANHTPPPFLRHRIQCLLSGRRNGRAAKQT